MVTSNDTDENETGTQYEYLVTKLESYGFKLIENDGGWFYTIKCLNTNEIFLMQDIGEVRAFLSAVAHVFSEEYIKEKFRNECNREIKLNEYDILVHS